MGITALAIVASACAGPVDSRTPATERAGRRAYDGAPPVAPHDDFDITCTQCHNERGMQVEGIGFAPATPHAFTAGLSARARCRQCHVFTLTDDVWVASAFVGLEQDLAPGRRLNSLAPPTMPHPVFMRENCSACHIGPAVREEIRTTHPDRVRCRQCHVPTTKVGAFDSTLGEGLSGDGG